MNSDDEMLNAGDSVLTYSGDWVKVSTSWIDDNHNPSFFKPICKFDDEGRYHCDNGPAIIYANGAKKWYKHGLLHREDGPAIIDAVGNKAWHRDGELHRDQNDGPAQINLGKFGEVLSVAFYENGKLHRDNDKPALIINSPTRRYEWYQHGSLHRPSGKAASISGATKVPLEEYKTSRARKRSQERQRRAGSSIPQWKAHADTRPLNHGFILSWYNQGHLHREDGPAIIYPDGRTEWYQDDWLHREDGPAIEWPNGGKHWYQRGKKHREDGPAENTLLGGETWYLYGKLHRGDGLPAVVNHDTGEQSWYEHGVHYREDGLPHFINQYGAQAWYDKQGELHREDGPAWVDLDEEAWYTHGKINRDGNLPAVINSMEGTEIYAHDGIACREDGPAIIRSNHHNKDAPCKEWMVDYRDYQPVFFDSVSNGDDYRYRITYTGSLDIEAGIRHRIDGPALIYPSGDVEYFIDDRKLGKKAWENAVDAINRGLTFNDIM